MKNIFVVSVINTEFIALWIWSSPKISLLRSRPVCIRTLMLMNSLSLSQKYLGTLSASLNTTIKCHVSMTCFSVYQISTPPWEHSMLYRKKSKVITSDIKKIMQQRDDAHELASQTLWVGSLQGFASQGKICDEHQKDSWFGIKSANLETIRPQSGR